MLNKKQLAQRKRRNQVSSLIIVDHLAFTIKLSATAKLHEAGQAYKRLKFAELPKQKFKKVKCVETFNQLVMDYQSELRHICWLRFEQFIDKVCGFRLSPQRDRGLHGYSSSYSILTKTGNHEVGLVGIGGNNDTIYVQFSGTACTDLFSRTRPLSMSTWLEVLGVTTLSRIDLAYDCYDDNYNAEYALKAYDDDAFKNRLGGRNPEIGDASKRRGKIYTQRMITVGSRTSKVYWRIYDKALEQKVTKSWWRTEVELKKAPLQALSNPAEYFASLNKYANSFALEAAPKKPISKTRETLSFFGKIHWLRRQAGRAIYDVVEAFDGDLEQAIGSIIGHQGGKYHIPDVQKLVIQQLAIEGQKNDFEKRYRSV